MWSCSLAFAPALQVQFFDQVVLFEPPESGLPAGLLTSPCLIQVVRSTIYIPVVNVGTTEVLLYPHTSLGTLSSAQVISLPIGVNEVRSTMATASSQVAGSPVQSGVEAEDLSALAEQDQAEVQSLLQKYRSVFSTYEGHLGCSNLILHDIHLLDNTPIPHRYKHFPPRSTRKQGLTSTSFWRLM